MSRKRAATARKSSTQGGGFDDNELLRRVGLGIRVARVGRGLSQRELAARVGRSQNLVWSIESGKKDPGVVLLAKVAEALEMPLDFFLIPIQKPRSESSESQRKNFQEGQSLMVSLMEALAPPADEPHAEKGES